MTYDEDGDPNTPEKPLPDVEVIAKSDGTIEVIVPDEAKDKNITVIVTDEDDKPVKDKDVVVKDESGEREEEGTTDSSGKVTFLTTYKIAYELMGGDNDETNPTFYKKGEGVASFKAATKEGYTFLGWYTNDLSQRITSISAEEEGDIVLYAKWKRTNQENPEDEDWTRLAGSNRFATNAEVIADGEWEQGGTVVLATGDNFPDALSASGLAGLNNAPVVLTPTGSGLSDEAKATLENLKPSKVYIMGNENAVSAQAAAEVTSMGATVERIGGSNRLETANAIYEEGRGSWGNTAIITWGDGFADALSVSPAAYQAKMPVFLTNSDASLDAKYMQQIKDGGFTRVLALGQENRVSAAVEKELKAAGIDVVRLAGSTRIETSVKIAKWTEGCVDGVSYDHMLVATASKFPDALSGGALAGKRGTVLVLAEDSASGTYAASEIVAKNAAAIGWGTFLGDENSISETVANVFEEASKG